MTSSANLNPEVGATPTLQAITSDIASLKRDLAQLMGHLKLDAVEGARATARNAVDQISDEAVRAYDSLTAQGERSLKAIGRQVEEQPVLSLLLAFALGFLGSRMFLR